MQNTNRISYIKLKYLATWVLNRRPSALEAVTLIHKSTKTTALNNLIQNVVSEQQDASEH